MAERSLIFHRQFANFHKNRIAYCMLDSLLSNRDTIFPGVFGMQFQKIWAIFCLLLLPSWTLAQKPSRDLKVRDDKAKFAKQELWLYNDIPGAFAKAAASKKPIVVVLRCLPCEECVKLDDDLVDQDPATRALLEQFVCVRVVGTNGLDLSLFQYDTDQSFAVFFLNADKTIYGRFGTRSHRTDWLEDVSLQGLQQALQGALELHKSYPENKILLAAKRGPAPEFPTPEKYPSLAGKYTAALNYEGDVVKSCIHCHQIGDAQRQYYRDQSQPIPESVLFPYPHPKSIGLILDPNEKATVKEVVADSWAAAAKIQAGDKISHLNLQPLLSMADVQWVLHNTPATGGELLVQLERAGKIINTKIALPGAWRRVSDISWRSTSWGLRRMVTGGMVLESITKQEREALNIAEGSMALRAKHVGEYNAHAAAKNAGFRKGDILTSYNGQTNLMLEADLFFHSLNQCRIGERVPVTILREGKKLEFMLPMQK
jgi:serine protease Do